MTEELENQVLLSQSIDNWKIGATLDEIDAWLQDRKNLSLMRLALITVRSGLVSSSEAVKQKAVANLLRMAQQNIRIAQLDAPAAPQQHLHLHMSPEQRVAAIEQQIEAMLQARGIDPSTIEE